MVQEALAASEPPVRLMVEVFAAAVAVPPQVLVKLGVDAMSSPPGSTSVKLKPVRAVAPEVVLEIVKVKVLLLPTTTGSVPKDFEMVGGGGFGQPVIVTLSRKMVSSVLLPAPTKKIRKYVVAALAGVDVLLETVPQAFLKVLVAHAPVPL